ncbi:beta-1,6-N-acetylglucosaminyltransferase [Phnomibacter ginsenosidimutans]|nr:beta-1,6-N-acetylglucosaminyltransferase [Phnomibacter ginsenosidimutans]
MKICILILAHKNPQQLKRLVARLHAEHYEVLVHVDLKAREIFEPFESYMFSTTAVYWGGYSTVKATLELFDKAMTLNADYYFLISGQDYPLQTRKEIERQIDTSKILMSYDPLPIKGLGLNDGLERYRIFHFQDTGKWVPPFPSFLTRLKRRLGINRKFLKGKKPFVGSQWFGASKEVLAFLLQETEQYEWYFKYVMLSDEMTFHTILANSDYAIKVTNNNFRKIAWDRPGPKPYVWQTSNLEELITSDAFFARKFDCENNFEIFDAIDSHTFQPKN